MTEDNDNIPSPDDSTLDPPEISPAPSPGSMSDPLLGTKIGSCTLKRLIGSGGMGTVYEATSDVMESNGIRRAGSKKFRGIWSVND